MDKLKDGVKALVQNVEEKEHKQVKEKDLLTAHESRHLYKILKDPAI